MRLAIILTACAYLAFITSSCGGSRDSGGAHSQPGDTSRGVAYRFATDIANGSADRAASDLVSITEAIGLREVSKAAKRDRLSIARFRSADSRRFRIEMLGHAPSPAKGFELSTVATLTVETTHTSQGWLVKTWGWTASVSVSRLRKKN